MELEQIHMELLERINKECAERPLRFPSEGTPLDQLLNFQNEALVLLKLRDAGYIKITVAHRESQTGRRLYDSILVSGLTASGRRALNDPKLRLRLDQRLRERVLLALYERARSSGFSSAHSSLSEELALQSQLNSDQVGSALGALKSQGWAKPETLAGHYSLTPTGRAAAERLIEGAVENPMPYSVTFTNYGQVGAMGPSAQAQGNTFQQSNGTDSIDAATLARELSLLREWLESHATDPHRADDVDAVALAHNAARRGQVPQALHALSQGSRWLLDGAKQVGAGLLVELLNKQMGQ